MGAAATDPAGTPARLYQQTQETTVRHLGELYTIVVGLSLSSAIADMYALHQPTTDPDAAAREGSPAPAALSAWEIQRA